MQADPGEEQRDAAKNAASIASRRSRTEIPARRGCEGPSSGLAQRNFKQSAD
jgi:hypothetical protein